MRTVKEIINLELHKTKTEVTQASNNTGLTATLLGAGPGPVSHSSLPNAARTAQLSSSIA